MGSPPTARRVAECQHADPRGRRQRSRATPPTVRGSCARWPRPATTWHRGASSCSVGAARRVPLPTRSPPPGAVTVSARKDAAAARTAELAHGETMPWSNRADAAAAADIIVNATPDRHGRWHGPIATRGVAGQPCGRRSRVPPARDAVARRGRSPGAQTVDGLGMLVYQAALQIREWTGQIGPVAVMRAAALEALAPIVSLTVSRPTGPRVDGRVGLVSVRGNACCRERSRHWDWPSCSASSRVFAQDRRVVARRRRFVGGRLCRRRALWRVRVE